MIQYQYGNTNTNTESAQTKMPCRNKAGALLYLILLLLIIIITIIIDYINSVAGSLFHYSIIIHPVTNNTFSTAIHGDTFLDHIPRPTKLS